jgi:hypothetical protein
MTQVIQAKCPFCKNVLRIPADWLSQPMRCKFCKQVIEAKVRSIAGAAVPAPVAAPPVAVHSAAEAQAAFAAPPVGVAAAPALRGSGGLFSFDEAQAAVPLPMAKPSPRKKGKGWLIVALLLLSLSTIAVLVVIFIGPQLRDMFQGKATQEPVAVETNTKGRQPENADKSAINADKNGGTQDKEVPPTDKSGKKGPAVATDKTSPSDKKSVTPETPVTPPKKEVTPPPKKKPVPKAQEYFPRRALLINVNNYWMLNTIHYGSPPSAGYPGSSTSELARRLSIPPMYFPATQVIELSDSAAEPMIPVKSVIESAITEFCNSSREQDRILVLFAGHALDIEKEAYLVPYEGLKSDAKTLISLSWVYDQLAKCKARQKIFVLDAFRNPTARGEELPGTGALTEDFDVKLQNPPAGVQVWSACVKDQQSIEFERGSLFMQALCNSLQERLQTGDGFAKPEEAIPIEILVPRVNQRMKELLSKSKLEQVSRLSGKEPDSGAAYDAKQPLPPKMALKPPIPAEGKDLAGRGLVNEILDEIKRIPPMKASLKEYMATLRAEAMPPFPKQVMDFYTVGYKSWGDLEAMLKKEPGKYPLREAVLEAKKALDEADGLNFAETLIGPINEKKKADFLNKQKEPALHIFKMEEALARMKEAEEMRDKEDSKRWHANFDYTLARLMSRLVYIDEYNFTLGRIRGDNLPPLEGDDTLWRLGFKAKLSTNEAKARTRVKEIAKLWQRIGKEHPNTPWALLAQRESMYAIGLEWRASRD